MKAFRIGFCGALALLCVRVAYANEMPINWTGLPEPYQTRSAMKPPLLVPRPPDAQLRVPPGFRVEEYLSGLRAPRFMTPGPSGEVLCSDLERGIVYVLRDRVPSELITGLDGPYGLAFHEQWLYVAEVTSIKRYPYDRAARQVRGPGVEVIALSGLTGGHRTRTLLFEPTGAWLYVGIGSHSNVSAGEDPRRAAINRYRPEGGGHEIYASGLRNPVGLRWYPGTTELWATSVERDGLGDELPPDFLTRVEPGGFYGWPYAYIGPHEDPKHKGAAPGRVRKALYPSVLLGAHVASLDFIFYSGTQFPERYRGGAFVALHGSWNRSRPAGFKVAFVPFRGGKPLSGPEDFLSGWLLSPDQHRVWGRPVGLLELPDGSILISDDGGGRIWRVWYAGS